jgi:hypothetical protein
MRVVIMVTFGSCVAARCAYQLTDCRLLRAASRCAQAGFMSTLRVSEETARLCASVVASAPVFEVFDGTMLPIAEMSSGMTSNLQNGVCTVY